MKFNGLKYDVSGENWDINFSKNTPNCLVKFYSNNQFNQEAVMEQYLYLTHISQYNDAYDGSEHLLDFTYLDKISYEEWYKNYLPNIQVVPYEIDKGQNFATFKILYKSFMAWVGSVSFTIPENIYNTLMWSHYASNSGFAVIFKFSELRKSIADKGIFDGFFFPINYVKKLRLMNPYDIRYGEQRGAMLYLISTKIKDWKYEKEWRLSCYPKNGRFEVPETLLTPTVPGIERKLPYTRECVDAIVIGEQFFNIKNVDCATWRKGSTPNEYKLKEDIKFASYLYEHFNDRLFINGPLHRKGKLVRVLQQIKLKKESDDTYWERKLNCVRLFFGAIPPETFRILSGGIAPQS